MALAPAFTVISPVATTAPVATASHVGSQRSGGFASTGAGTKNAMHFNILPFGEA